MAEELISSYVDTAAIEKETQFLVGRLEEVYILFGKIKNIKIELQGSKSFMEVANSIKKVQEQEQLFSKLQEQINQSYARKKIALDEVQKAELALIKTYEKRQANTSDIAKDLAEEKLLLAEQAKQMKENAKEALGMVSAYEKLQKQFIEASKEAKEIGATLGTNNPKYTEAAAKANELNEKLKAIDGGIGNFQRNVGNYAGSLSPLIDQLKNELKEVQTEMGKAGKSSDELAKLAKQSQLLESSIKNLDVAMGSTKQELRSFTEAAKKIGLEYGIASRQFQEFVKEVGAKKDDLEDIQAAINFQATDYKYLEGTIQAVNGVAGAFSAAEGASVLFGGAGKDLQETMAKLQALIALTTGLQQLLNTVQTESGAIQTVLAAKTGLLTAAEGVNARIKGLLLGTTEAQVVATSEQAIANEAAAVTNLEVATTGGTAAAAMGAEATATGAATTATYSFATALTATGIGAIIIAIGAALVYVVSKVSDYVNANNIAIEKETERQKSLSNSIDAINNLDKAIDISTQKLIKNLELINEKKKAQGLNAEQILALDLKTLEQKKILADTDVKFANVSKASVDELNEKLIDQQGHLTDLVKARQKLLDEGKKADSGVVEDINKEIELQQIRVDNAQKSYDRENNLLQNQADIQNQIELKKIENSRRSAEDQRKLTLETTKLNAELIIDANNRVLSNEKSTQKQRLAATKELYSQQRIIAEAENNAIQNDPTQSNAAKVIAANSLSNKLIELNRTEKESINKINEDYFKRKLAAEKDYFITTSNMVIAENEKIFNNENVSLEKRLSAFNQYQENKKAQVDKEYEYQKELNKINGSTKEERELLEADHQAKITALVADSNAKQIEIQLSAYEVVTQKLEDEFNKRQNIIEKSSAIQLATLNKDYANQVTTLNDKLQQGKISIVEYNQERKRLDDTFNKSSLESTGKYLKEQLESLKQANKQSLEDRDKYIQEYNKLFIKTNKTQDEKDELITLSKKIDNYKDYAKQIAEIDKQIADNQKQLSDSSVELQIEAQTRLRDAYQEIATSIVDLAKSIIDGAYTAELNAIQDQVDALENKKTKDIEVADQTSLNEEQKAAKIKIIEAKAQAEREQLEQRKRRIQLEQARFERAFNIAGIIFNTSKAVIAALAPPPVGLGPVAGVPLAVATGVLGAIQLAKAVSTPLPKYAQGTTDHIGGKAIVGDGGKHELAITPTGQMYITPKVPTVVDLPEHTIVYPDVDKIGYNLANNALNKTHYYSTISSQNIDLVNGLNSLDKRMQSVEQAIKNKKETHFTVTRYGLMALQQQDNNYLQYLNENTKF